MITVLRKCTRSDKQATGRISLRASSPFGGYCETYTRERRRDSGGRGRERRKFRAGQLGLLSIYFDFRNVIFEPMVFRFVKAKYKWNFMRGRCKFSFARPLAASPLARPNRRACSQAIDEFLTAWKIWPDTLFPPDRSLLPLSSHGTLNG